MKLTIQLNATNLPNVAGLFKGISDPFAVVTLLNTTRESKPSIVGETEVQKNTLNPDWSKTFTIEHRLGTPTRILVKIFDRVRKTDKNIPMGSAVFDVSAVLGARGSTMAKKLKNGGRVFVRVLPHEKESDGHDEQQPAPVLPPAPVSTNPQSAVPPHTSTRPTFQQYISGGCEINLTVAIDCTASNGNPHDPGTLHYKNQDGSLNDYEKAIKAIGSILEKFDSDKKFPVWGYGARPQKGSDVEHCFSLHPEREEVDGVDGILDVYHDTFKSDIVMSGPTVFTEVIQTAAFSAISHQEAAFVRGKQKYSILLIVTDGVVSDVNRTLETINSVHNAPLSIVIVGVGNADFSGMQFLDDAGSGRDIVQFVEFDAHKHCSTSLTNATLDEIPRQLEEYFVGRGIMPNPPVHVEEEEILVEAKEDSSEEEIGAGGQW